MAVQISNAFVVQYESEVENVYQRMGGYLRVAVRNKGDIQGLTTTFFKIGTGVATEKARHGVITPMNQDHTAVTCTLSDFYAGDWVDKLDEDKITIDERMAIAQGGAWAIGRKVDDQILTVLDTQTGTPATPTLNSEVAIENAFLDWAGSLDEADTPDDGMRFGVVTPKIHQFLMKLPQYTNADYVEFGADDPIMNGANILRFRRWLGVNWIVHSGVQGKGTATAKCFVWHRNAVGYATGTASDNTAANDGKSISADITWHGDRASYFVNHSMSGGACLIHDDGVTEVNFDDTAALPTS